MQAKYLPDMNRVRLIAETPSEGFMLAHLEAKGELEITEVSDTVKAVIRTDPDAVYDSFYGEEE